MHQAINLLKIFILNYPAGLDINYKFIKSTEANKA